MIASSWCSPTPTSGGRHELFAVLVREHLSEYPDHVLAAWIAAEHA